MTRVMRDSTRATDIPVAGTQLAAGYANGIYRWTTDDWARFPGIPHVYIDVIGDDPVGCGVLDVENGDASVTTAVTWTRDRKAHYGSGLAYPPLVYCNRSTLTPLFNAMGAAGLAIVRDYRLWIATLDGVTKTVPDMTGVTAVQWRPATASSGPGHHDESIVYDTAWHEAATELPPVRQAVIELADGQTETVYPKAA